MLGCNSFCVRSKISCGWQAGRGTQEAGHGGLVFPTRSIHGLVTKKTQASFSASRKALRALYFGRHRRCREARKSI